MTWELTPELHDKIFGLISGGASLRKIGRMDDMPSRDTITRWMETNKEFAASVARARELKYEDDIEQLEEINEKLLTGQLGASEATVVSNNLKWVASRLLPKKYGDKIDLNHGGQPEGVPMQSKVVVEFVGAKPND